MLTQYKKKRNFKNTPEPSANKKGDAATHRFVVQKHNASHLHYDFRLQLNGTLKSWAVPKGPSMNAADKRLAVQVEDHPVSYINFSGIIPKGNYGAGTVEIWDKGNFTPVDEKGKEITEKQAMLWLNKGQLKFSLQGKKLHGEFVLVRLKNDEKNWLLIKHKDEHAVKESFNPETKSKLKKDKVSIAKSPQKTEKITIFMNETPKEKNDMKINEKESLLKVNGHELKLTNLTKIYWPKEKITKGEMIAYYEKMATVILPYLKNRPLSLKRNPNGLSDKGFYQKDAGEHFPGWIKTAAVHADSTGKTVHYTICNDKATLLYLANLGCIEMNPWNSTIKSPDKPTYLIIDIDPSEKNTFTQVIETAQVVNDILEKACAPSYCKTSGATGLHVYIPLNAKYTYEQARQFGELVAMLAQEQLPRFTSLERSLAKRGNNIYIDYLQNSRGQTIASAYSVRPMPGAQVSAPLLWKEVKEGLHPSSFTIFNMEKRVKQLGDIFYMATQKGINIPSCLKKLGQ